MTKTKKGETPKQLAPHIEALRAQGKQTRDLVELAVRGSLEPLTTFEVANLVHQLGERKYDLTYIKRVLEELAAEGVISSRMETEDERLLRAGGKSVRGAMAKLYWSGGKHVKRATRVLVSGVELNNEVTQYTTWRRSVERTSKKTSGLVAKPKMQTGTLESIIESMILEHVGALQARVDDLENKLTAMKKAIN